MFTLSLKQHILVDTSVPIRKRINQCESSGMMVWASDLVRQKFPNVEGPGIFKGPEKLLPLTEWLDENFGRENWVYMGRYYFFNSDADAAHFKLYWSEYLAENI